MPNRLSSRPALSLFFGLCLLSLRVLGQTKAATSDGDTLKLAAFTVTGSNIKGVDTEKTLPVTVITTDEVTNSGVGSMAELIETMPYSTNVSINDASTGPNDARGDVSSINLRNLGAGRTLVLLNGRRLSAYGVSPGTPPVQFVNVNAIPLGAVQQVEVLRDGASAVYGSEAMGGVVNTILKKAYQGAEADVRYSYGESGGPEEVSASLGGGRRFNEGRTSITYSYSYSDREGVMASDRVYAADADKRSLVGAPFNTNSSFNRRSSSGPYGRFTAVNDSGTAVSVSGVTNSSGNFYYDATTGVRTAGTGATATYNSQQNTQLIPDLTRNNLFLAAEHQLKNHITFFGEYAFYDSHASGGFDATPISSSTDGIIVPKTNYYSPVGVNSGVSTPRAVLIRNYRVVEAGPRTYDTDSDSHRILAGARGEIGKSTWSWESGLLYMRSHTYQENHGYISQSKFLAQLALNTPEAYNPFAPGTNSKEIVKKFVIDIWDDGRSSLTTWDAKTSGELFNLPGGPVSLAVGGEFRRETMKQLNDPYGLADDVVAQSEQLDVNAGRNVSSGYAELLVPLVGKANRLAFLQSAELRAAARYEYYKGFNAVKPGVGLSLRPRDWLLLRASYNEGFRAPSVTELYTPAVGRRNEGYIDTARSGQSDAISSVSKRVVTGGNDALNPEESKSYNVGFVVDPPFLKGLSVGADLYRIRQRNQIDNSDAQDELDLDAALWTASHGSNPRVLREAQTASDIAANIPGTLIEVISTYQNLSLRETEGVDLFLNYRLPRMRFGRITFTSALNYTKKLRTIDEKGNVSDLVRNDGNPRVKSTFGFNWINQGWSASVQERYTSNYQASSAYTTNGIPFIVNEYWVTNASVGYSFRQGRLQGVRCRIGVNNVFGQDPPFYPGSSAGYDSSYADARGRVAYIDFSYKF